MALVATDIKGMLSIAVKSRHDPHTDQYSRIFMVKLCLVVSLVMGISWFQDSISCIIPGNFYYSHFLLFTAFYWLSPPNKNEVWKTKVKAVCV